ncbi:MAG TPA: iron-containing alcohol dehydrogenase, partial [Lachnospiraceae bacterium]|nr:iron-containing alcohol dehydrogenase [Lachnospiraceae bacterium]
EPNPKVTSVDEGVKICREHDIEVVLPVGGGSSIDCAKCISAAYYYQGPAWDLVLNNSLAVKALPIITIITIAATGSEMDYFSVISNTETNDKLDFTSRLLYPKYTIMDPEYTYTVPPYQTASGTADIMSHVFEIYFSSTENTYMQDRFMEGLLNTCVTYGPIACREPANYDARANLLWTSSWAINGFISCGKGGPWPCHSIEHQLSAFYDVTHGHGLAVIIPVWMNYILNDTTVELFVNYGTHVFGIDASKPKFEIAKEAIAKTKQLFIDMGLSLTLRELGIPDKENFGIMAQKASAGLEHCLVPLNKDDIITILDQCF